MRFVIRLAAFVLVGLLLNVFTRCEVEKPATEEEEVAYKSWVEQKGQDQAVAWDTDDPSRERDYEQEPYADPDLYAAHRVVLQPGDTWRNEVVLSLAGGSDRDAKMSDARYAGNPGVRVTLNEWADDGIEVVIESVSVEGYVYPTWLVNINGYEVPLRTTRPLRSAEEIGALNMTQLVELIESNTVFNVASFNPAFDVNRGNGRGWTAHVSYSVTLPLDLLVGPEDRSQWGRVTLSASAGKQSAQINLIHLEGQQGLAVRPWHRPQRNQAPNT